MNLRQPEDQHFSMIDFEKGLVLAGLLTPVSIQELEEIDALKKFESHQDNKIVKKDDAQPYETKKLYFKRVVLAAEIVSELHDEPTFGRVKFQKLVFLCEHAALMNLQHRYLKLVAGPFDNKFMHSIEKEFKRQNWFAVEKVKQTTMTRSKYLPLNDCDGYKKYYSSYFHETESRIKQIIELFRKKNTAFAEIAATLFACCLELKEKEGSVNQEQLLSRFYEWSESKQQYERQTVLDNWTWLQENGLIPVEEE